MSTEPQSPDDLDRLFGTYLKAQLPKHWPGAPVQAQPAPIAAADPSSRSRLTLAVSAAALLGLGLYLSAGPRQPAGPNAVTPRDSLLSGSTAEGGKMFKTTPTPKN